MTPAVLGPGHGRGGRGIKTELTGTTAERVRDAALKAVPGGTVLRVETDSDGSPYEAHVRKADGTEVVAKVNEAFEVTSVEEHTKRSASTSLEARPRSARPQRCESGRLLGPRPVARRRCFVFRVPCSELLDEQWQRTVDGLDPTIDQRADLLMGAVHAMQSAGRAVELVYSTAGTTGFYERSRLARLFRDTEVLKHHGFVNESRYETIGQVLFGLPPDMGFLLSLGQRGYSPNVLATISRWISLVPPYTVETSVART